MLCDFFILTDWWVEFASFKTDASYKEQMFAQLPAEMRRCFMIE